MTNPITAKHQAETSKEIQLVDIKEFLKKKKEERDTKSNLECKQKARANL